MATAAERLAAVEQVAAVVQQRIADHEVRCEERLGEIKATAASTLQAVESLKTRQWQMVAALLAWALAQLWSSNSARFDKLETQTPPAVARSIDNR